VQTLFTLQAEQTLRVVTPTPIPFDSSLLAPAVATETPLASASLPPACLFRNYNILQQNDDYPTVQQLQLRLMNWAIWIRTNRPPYSTPQLPLPFRFFQRTINETMDGVATSELQEPPL
jgi:hypothetical protein